MAFNIHWQLLFCNRDNEQYTVNIYDDGYTGNIISLVGADQPFYTSEDADEDIFTPIRSQSGYIRVIDIDGNLLEQISPANNVQRMVKVFKGGDVKWQGFVAATAYSQAWITTPREVEIPVNSMLATLQYIDFGLEYAAYSKNLAYLLVRAMYHLYAITGEYPFSNVRVIDNEEIPGRFFMHRLQYAVFYEQREINNGGDTVIEWTGKSLYDILSELCSLYGVTMREDGRELYMANYDSRVQNSIATYTWSNITAMSNGRTVTPAVTALADISLLDSINFLSDDNSHGRQQGAKSVAVSLGFETNGLLDIHIPPAVEDDSEVKTVVCKYQEPNGSTTTYNVLVQPHPTRTGTNETWSFFKYEYSQYDFDSTNYNWWKYIGSSSYAEVLNNSVMNPEKMYWSPTWEIGRNNYTGAFPCRWVRYSDNEMNTLASGLFLSTNYIVSRTVNSNINVHRIYMQTSPLGVTLRNGYVRVTFNLTTFEGTLLRFGSTAQLGLIFTDTGRDTSLAVSGNGYTLCYAHLAMVLTNGSRMYWNNNLQTWQTASVVWAVEIKNGKVISNYQQGMGVEKKDAYYIPVDNEMTGKMEFALYDCVRVDLVAEGQWDSQIHARNHIMYNLEVDFVEKNNSITVSQRTSNRYYKSILSAGFSEEREKSLTIGTFNNNLPSPSFITDSSNNYIQTMAYNDGAQRPEMNLLARMADFYSSARHIITPTVKDTVALMAQRYVYEGRVYFGVADARNWRDTESEVKFLEARTVNSRRGLPQQIPNGGVEVTDASQDIKVIEDDK